MKIAVYLSSEMGKLEAYRRETEAIAEWIAEEGHELIYGGTVNGLMGVLSETAYKKGVSITGVVPEYEKISTRIFPNLTNCIRCKDMAERKNQMMELADAFIALPGGPGTLDELSDILCLMRVGAMKKPMVLLDVEGFYQPLKAFFDGMLENGFADEKDFSRVCIAGDMEQLKKYLTDSICKV